jgi:ABC-2 type transport system ATP-binding protein
MDNVAIRTENLSRDFPAVRAVDALTMTVPTGVIFGFLGPNGAGKTTTIHLLLGLLQPTSGQAEVLGFDVWTRADAIRQHTGVLLEHTGLYERLNAEDNLEFYGRIWRMSSQERKTRIKELLSSLDLWERRHDIVGSWSRGMKQKLAVARTMLHHPSLIFLDEPTAGLDPIAAAQLRDTLTTLATREGVTIFLTTHNLAEAEVICDQVAVIRQGKLAAVGTPDELRTRSSSHQITIVGRGFHDNVLNVIRNQPVVQTALIQNGVLQIQLHNKEAVASLIQMIIDLGGEVEEVNKPKDSLEEVFFTLMEQEQ